MSKCMLAGCENLISEQDILYFRLPVLDPVMKQKWLTSLKMSEPKNGEESFVCSRHFPNDSIENGDLKIDAVPTINIPEAIMEANHSSFDELKKQAECEISFKIFGYTCRICGCSTEDIENMESIMDESNNLIEKISQCLSIIISNEDNESEDEISDSKILNLEGPITCDFCGEIFTDIHSFNSHIEKEKQDHDIIIEQKPGTVIHTVCSLCGQIFPTRAEYDEHSIKKLFDCSDCKKSFSSACDLVRHKKHKCEDKFFCGQCFSTFSTNQELEYHKEMHNANNLFCYVCNQSWASPEEFVKHSCDNLEESKCVISSKKQGYECSLCGRSYKRYSNLSKHWSVHLEDLITQPYCKNCNLLFKNRQDFMDHLRDQHYKQTRMFVCRFCGKAMTTKLSLNIHERIHMQLKPYICEWCGNEFRSKANLSQHQAKHTGIRNHECGVCGKMFSRKAFVTTHMRTHTGERPYSCDLCDHRFSQIGDMRRHRKRHDNQAAGKKKNTSQTIIMVDEKNLPFTQLMDNIQFVIKSEYN
uniref:Protein krueppel n=1 Tax=Clastoptera arizonana TaxID=38151 RepID=A0A1B6E2Q8_9HEMI